MLHIPMKIISYPLHILTGIVLPYLHSKLYSQLLDIFFFLFRHFFVANTPNSSAATKVIFVAGYG